MLLCDRCGKELTYQERKNNERPVFTIYSAQGAYIGHYVDLCSDCKRQFDDYKGKMESYFMVATDDPIEILDGVKYWDAKKKYR